MSVINRIEIANLLNKHGDVASPWDAKMRHLLLDLRGQSSAVSMENGFGKTTMAEALIGLLSRDRMLISRTRRKCSPSSVGGSARSWSHVRVEFRSRGGNGRQDDMLAAMGEEVAGETFVFGFYGYSDGSGLSFYHYTGTLENIPVHHHTADGKLALYANSDVKDLMSQYGVRLTVNRDEWLEAVSVHVSRRELNQLAAFQKEGGADKSQIFNAIRPRGGENPDQAFFFEVLAPEILAGATRGETDEGEELIEEVILNSGSNITELRYRLEDAEGDQRRTEAKVERLGQMQTQSLALQKARADLAHLDDGLMLSERLLGGQALAGLPGLPRVQEDSQGQDVVSGLAWAQGDIGRPRVSVWLLARLSRQSERQVREALSARGLRLDGHRQLIHLPEAAWPAGREPHHLGFDAARQWLEDSQAFADDATRYRAIERLDEAADVFETLDGNVWRDEVVADGFYRTELKSDITDLDERADRLEQEREILESRQREFIDNQSFYTQALAEGLFSEQELEQPEATREAALEEAQSVRRALSTHLARAGELKQVAEQYRDFQSRCPGSLPDEVLAEKTAQCEQIDTRLEDLGEQCDRSHEALDQARQRHEQLASERARLEGELVPLKSGKQAWQSFCEQWPNAEVEGWWAGRQAQLREWEGLQQQLGQRQQEAGRLRQRLAPLAESAAHYRQVHGEDEPVHLRDRLYSRARELDDERHRLGREEVHQRELHRALVAFRERGWGEPQLWLEQAREALPRLIGERERLDERIAARSSYLEHLSGDPLARQVAESEARQLLERQEIGFRPLHQVLAELAEDEASRRAWLIQAAGQLFAPVVEGGDSARAAQLLIDHGLNVPVLELGRLHQLLSDGNPPLGAVCGCETLAVKAALDPEYLVELRNETQARLERDLQRRRELDIEINCFDPHGEVFVQALSARQAVDDGVEQELERIAARSTELEQLREELAPRLTEVALQSIDDFQRYLQEGGDKALQDASESLAEIKLELAELTPRLAEAREEFARHSELWLAAEAFKSAGGVERLATIDHRLLELEERTASAAEARHQQGEHWEALSRERDQLNAQRSAVFADGERDRLASLAAFVAQDGPDFMATAEEQQVELEASLSQAQRRASLDAQRIRAYLDVRNETGTDVSLEKRIAGLKRSQKDVRSERRSKQAELEQLEQRLEQGRQALRVCDELAIAWLAALRDLSDGWMSRLQGTDGRQATWPVDLDDATDLDDALGQWWMTAAQQDDEPFRQQGDDEATRLERLTAAAHRLQDGLQRLGLGERSRIRDRQAQEVQKLEQELVVALDDAAQSRLFNETERARLSRLRSGDRAAQQDLEVLHAQLSGQLDRHRETVARLQQSRDHIEGTLVERLGSIISDAASNLDILKRVARRGQQNADDQGGAWFEVRASLIDAEALKALIATLLADIDEHQATLRRRAERSGDTLEDVERSRRDDDLLGRIRRRIYRGLFKDVSIRLRHPAIRPHGRLFSLNETMSEGQREAVSLMWLVKLSEFAIERELRELPGRYRRRAQASRESVILLDGLFSKLSHRRLIQDSLESLRNTRGRFQMIGLIHNPNYENDPDIFPTYLVGSVIGGVQGQGGHVVVRDGRVTAPEELGLTNGEASLFGLHFSAPSQ